VLFAVSATLTMFTMFLLGAVKAKFTKENPLASGGQMLVNGIFAASVALTLGFLVEQLMTDVDD